MSENSPHYAHIVRPFGDEDHAFCLNWDKASELEEAMGRGCFAILHSLIATRMSTAKVNRETIRLALIGGGMPPVEALSKVRRYVEDRPIHENFDLTAEILEAAIYGSAEYQKSPAGLSAKERLAKAEKLGFPLDA